MHSSPRLAATPVAALMVAFALAGCTPAHLPGDEENPAGVCGDGKVSGAELCDDGNSESGDGCAADCQPEIPPNCGDGILIVEEGEECDDGNMEGGDGCGLGCWIEGCGNGFLDVGEACEDGNAVDGDGCSLDCKSDETCGNGTVDMVVGEVCDDGNDDDTDGCPASCEPARCGDGFVRKGVESCDDGNSAAGDGCTDCILDSCGDAQMDDGEECDQGAANGSDGSSCFRTCLTTTVVMEETDNDLVTPNANTNDLVSSISVGDINGDGRPDVFAVSQLNQRAATILGRGDGTLAHNNFSEARSSGSGSILADVNGDGRVDLIATDSSSTVAVLLGNGKGFAPHTVASTAIDVGGLEPIDVVAVDVNGDGKRDLVTANRSSNDITVLIGDGTGTFLPTARFGTQSGAGGVAPTALAVGDVTGDGVRDVLTANRDSSDVAVLPGLGNGAFGPPQIFSTVIGARGTGPIDIVLADVTNDGKLDVITANTDSSDVTVFAQQAGTLAQPLAFSTFVELDGLNPINVAVADLNKDGVPDIVTAGRKDVTVIPGLGAGVAFGAPQITPMALEGEGLFLRGLAIADLNGDNKFDVIVANATGSRDVRVLIGTGSGGFEPPKAFHLDVDRINQNPFEIHVTDVDGDGRRDVIAVTDRFAIALAGDGKGRLLEASLSTIGGESAGLGDFEGDGDLDYVCGTATNQNIQLGRVGVNGRVTTSAVGSQTSTFTLGAATGDFDGNGTLDAATVAGTTVNLLSGNGAGSFSAFPTAFVGLVQNGQHIVAADVTADGEIDLVIVNRDSNEVSVLIGSGTGAFTNAVPLPTDVGASGSSPVRVAVADLDGQMGADIITANQASNDFSVIRSTGSGTFAAVKIVPAVFGGTPATVSGVAAGDFNGDGHLDLASANRARSTISVVIGFGNGNFAAPQVYTIATPTAIGAGDFNGDGLDDVVVGTADGHVALLLGRGHP